MQSVIDMDQLLVFTKNDKEMAQRIIQAYASTVPQYIQEMQGAVSTNDPQTIRATCHKLIGAAKSVRAPQVVESVEHLRQQVIDQKLSEIPRSLAAIHAKLQAVVDYAKENNLVE